MSSCYELLTYYSIMCNVIKTSCEFQYISTTHNENNRRVNRLIFATFLLNQHINKTSWLQFEWPSLSKSKINHWIVEPLRRLLVISKLLHVIFEGNVIASLFIQSFGHFCRVDKTMKLLHYALLHIYMIIDHTTWFIAEHSHPSCHQSAFLLARWSPLLSLLSSILLTCRI